MTDDAGGPAGRPEDDPRNTPEHAGDELAATDDAAGRSPGRDWMGQLQSMIDNVATQAAPVMRDVAAKAAELAAAAGERAGPIAHKAADATGVAGAKLAERGREVAAELRGGARPDAGEAGGGAAVGDAPNSIDPGDTTAASPSTQASGGADGPTDRYGA